MLYNALIYGVYNYVSYTCIIISAADMAMVVADEAFQQTSTNRRRKAVVAAASCRPTTAMRFSDAIESYDDHIIIIIIVTQ